MLPILSFSKKKKKCKRINATYRIVLPIAINDSKYWSPLTGEWRALTRKNKQSLLQHYCSRCARYVPPGIQLSWSRPRFGRTMLRTRLHWMKAASPLFSLWQKEDTRCPGSPLPERFTWTLYRGLDRRHDHSLLYMIARDPLFSRWERAYPTRVANWLWEGSLLPCLRSGTDVHAMTMTQDTGYSQVSSLLQFSSSNGLRQIIQACSTDFPECEFVSGLSTLEIQRSKKRKTFHSLSEARWPVCTRVEHVWDEHRGILDICLLTEN